MHPDDADDPVELLGTPLNVELNPPDGAADEDQDDGAEATRTPRFDGSSTEPDTGFSSGH